jgi:hypothetical protein
VGIPPRRYLGLLVTSGFRLRFGLLFVLVFALALLLLLLLAPIPVVTMLSMLMPSPAAVGAAAAGVIAGAVKRESSASSRLLLPPSFVSPETNSQMGVIWGNLKRDICEKNTPSIGVS